MFGQLYEECLLNITTWSSTTAYEDGYIVQVSEGFIKENRTKYLSLKLFFTREKGEGK